MMLAFTVPDTKHFMSLLFKSDVFDDFCFRQGEISAFSHISIDGKRDMDFYDETETEPWCRWAELKHIVFHSIKGKKTPKQMKLIFSRPESETNAYENTAALFWNLLFREGILLCTLSVAQETFSLDKKSEDHWFRWVEDFCKAHGITIEKQN